MSPLADDATGLDLMSALRPPTVLVSGSYMGAVGHTLTALDVLRAGGPPVAALVVSQSADPEAPDFAATVRSVRGHADGHQVLGVPRGGDAAWARRVAGEDIDDAHDSSGGAPRFLAGLARTAFGFEPLPKFKGWPGRHRGPRDL